MAPRVLGQQSGLLRGKSELTRFFEEGRRRRLDELVRWHRKGGYLFSGRILFWEYQRAAPNKDQVDIAEVMELAGGHIVAHRIYWGWFGTEMLIGNAVDKDSSRQS